MSALKVKRLALQALVAVMLGACAGGGGGGGGGGVVLPPPPPGAPRPPPIAVPPLPPAAAPGAHPSLSSPEYLANWGPGGINAAAAWQVEDGHGEGVLIGVIDDGIDPSHPELLGRIHPNSIDIVPGRNALVTTLSHGSEIASIMVANFNGQQTVGPAFNATVLAIRADNGSGSFDDWDLAAAIDYAVAQGVDVINLSLGSPSPPSVAFRNAIANATAAGVIIVASAGNSGTSAGQPIFPGLLATNAAVSNGLILIAGGSNPDGSFNPISNPAGGAAMWYLVAPGWQIIVPDFGPVGPVPGFQQCGAAAGLAADLCRIQGTSYASPHVTAGIALLMSAFPGLTPQQAVQIILQSTEDMGVTGIDASTGWGRLNMERAFAPFGTVAAPLAAGIEITPEMTLGAAGPAFGDGLIRNTAVWSVAGFDAFGRTYPINLAGNWRTASPGPSAIAQAPRLWRTEQTRQGARVQMALAESVAPESLRLPTERADLEQPAIRIEASLTPGFNIAFAANGARTTERDEAPVSHLDMVQSEMSLRLTRQFGDHLSFSFINERGQAFSGLPFMAGAERQASAARVGLDFGPMGMSFTTGQLEEERGLLGLVWGDALGQTPGGATRFAGVGAYVDVTPDVRLSISGEFGAADFTQVGWLSVTAPLRTTAFSAEARANLTPTWLAHEGRGVLTISLSQPLRIESGEMSFMAPTATRYGRQSLAFEQRSFSPTPSGRELRFGLGYSYFAGESLSAFGEAIYVLDPGHVAGAEPDTVLRLGLRLAR